MYVSLLLLTRSAILDAGATNAPSLRAASVESRTWAQPADLLYSHENNNKLKLLYNEIESRRMAQHLCLKIMWVSARIDYL